ncbi:MAG TPA: hypothetical protein VGH56_07120, partial [Solirubrobacteraceae bacterium]
SALPVLALARGGPLSLVRHGLDGLLCPPDPQALAERLLELAASPLLRQRLATAGLAAVRERTWESALERLAGGYRRALYSATGSHGNDTRGNDARDNDTPASNRQGERGERHAA